MSGADEYNEHFVFSSRSIFVFAIIFSHKEIESKLDLFYELYRQLFMRWKQIFLIIIRSRYAHQILFHAESPINSNYTAAQTIL